MKMGGESMSKELALKILELLSAMESASLCGNKTPDYIYDQLSNVAEKLREIILESGK